MTDLTIYGLGQVGLRVALLAADQGFSVTGIDVDSEVVDKIQSDILPIGNSNLNRNLVSRIRATTDSASVIPSTDAILVCTPTPLVDNYCVNLGYVEAVFEDIGEQLNSQATVVIESTIPPGTTYEVGQQTLEKYGHTLDADFYLAHCPERIDPGNEEWPLSNIPRVIGGASRHSTENALSLYDHLLDAHVEPVSTPRTAASAKIVENAYRDINIAFVNELARSFTSTDIDVDEVLNAADTKPYGFTRFTPGPGVGGDCIPVDPYMLINTAKKVGNSADLLFRARNINDEMPAFVAGDIQDFLNTQCYPVKETKILQLGASFKGGFSGVTNSPANEVISHLNDRGGEIEVYDPYVPESSTVDNPYIDADLAAILTDHPEFKDLDLDRLSRSGINLLYDARYVIDPEAAIRSDLEFRRLGGKAKNENR